MRLSLNPASLASYVQRQLEAFFPDPLPALLPPVVVDEALERTARCFSAVRSRYFHQEGEAVFNHLNGDQYSMFLYLLSNALYKNGGATPLCDKIFSLNKLLHGIDVFYEVELPSIFLFCHPLGTVLGRARYADYLLVNQNCTVGAARAAEDNRRGVYPTLGRHVSLYAGASVLGACTIGDYCKIAAHSLIMNQDLAPGMVYMGTPQSSTVRRYPPPDNSWL